jgi:hypothetical protein
MKNKEKEMKKRLIKLQKEINTLEFKIDHPKITKIKKSFVKNLKLTGNVARLVAPYVLCAGIFFTTSPLVGCGRPFVSGDDIYTSASVMTEYNSFGEVRTEKQYSYLENGDNIISYYSKWIQKEDGSYVRDVKTYKLKKITEEEAIKLLDQEKIDLIDIVEDVNCIFEETKSNISEEEMAKGEFYQITLYSKDGKDTVFRTETAEENVIITLLYLFVSALCGCGVDYLRRVFTKFNYSNSVKSIKENYSEDDIEELKQKLELKLSNYNRLTR